MHAAKALSHFALSSPRRVVPMTQASRLDEQLEKSGWRCDEPGHSAWATQERATRMAGMAPTVVSFGMTRSRSDDRAEIFAPCQSGTCGVKAASKIFVR
jgi:hypothetical protein